HAQSTIAPGPASRGLTSHISAPFRFLGNVPPPAAGLGGNTGSALAGVLPGELRLAQDLARQGIGQVVAGAGAVGEAARLAEGEQREDEAVRLSDRGAR